MNSAILRAIIVSAGIAGILPPPASAETLCNASVQQTMAGVRTFARDFSATCRPGGACAVVTHMLNPEAPLGFSHVFGFRRETADERWRVMLLDEMQQTNAAAGMELRVDDGKPMKVPAELIGSSDAGNVFTFDSQLTELILAEAKPGNQLFISYTTTSGESLSAAFSLIGLTDALAWSTCAQGQLVSGKSDAAVPSAEDEEYSGPEPGVPISPDESQD